MSYVKRKDNVIMEFSVGKHEKALRVGGYAYIQSNKGTYTFQKFKIYN